MLDALLLNYSCRVKNPSQAIKSKLASENIVDVEEEDLLEFTNLSVGRGTRAPFELVGAPFIDPEKDI